ncbi:MAG: type IV secretory system conjugative DNA transfer family protein, partial [Candidatus Melainabacteria bacterium]|nr:type IV secretory system conjugative DNA transfer family protein [Candidatus Melainabacteria bacterium]
MTWRAQIDDRGVVTRYKDAETGEVISAKEYERRLQMQGGQFLSPHGALPQMSAVSGGSGVAVASPARTDSIYPSGAQSSIPQQATGSMNLNGMQSPMPQPATLTPGTNPLIQPGAQILTGSQGAPSASLNTGKMYPVGHTPSQPPTAGVPMQGKNLRMEGVPQHTNTQSLGYKAHGFLDATSIAILLPTLVLLALIIAAAHKKRLFPWQTIRTFNPPSGLINPREYERSFLCPPNLRRHGRLGKRNPEATWTEQDGIVLPFGFLARTHLPVTIPFGRLPNKNMFIVAPSGSGKTTLMRAVIKAMLAKPCVIIALEAKANDPNLDEKKEGFKYTVLPEAQQAGFSTLYFNPLDADSIHWNPLDLDPITFASSIVQDVNSLPPEEQHWAERDHGYIAGLATLLKWGAVMVSGEDENGMAAEVQPLSCNPSGLMRLVNNRRNIVESLRRLKNTPNVDAAELSELTQTLSSIIRTDTDWDKNIQGVRGRLRMFKNVNILRVTEQSNIDMRTSMHEPTVLIFGAPASLGPDAESLASCFVYQLQQALHTRYGTASVLPLFAFFDEYQTLNMDIAGRL